jgi:hypothetical protein
MFLLTLRIYRRDVHWCSAELYTHYLSNKKYVSRAKNLNWHIILTDPDKKVTY